MVLVLLTLVGLAVTCAMVLGGSGSFAVDRLAAMPPAAVAVVLGCSFQVTHFVEHVVQLGWWFAHPSAVPFLTPWARSAADGLSNSALGVEVLHLVGNTIFLLAAVALVSITSADPRRRSAAWWCVAIQGLHVAEHVALTVSVGLTGQAIGVSTVFGAIDAGPPAWSYRVWLHFGVNLLATVLALRAIRGLAGPVGQTGLRARTGVLAPPQVHR